MRKVAYLLTALFIAAACGGGGGGGGGQAEGTPKSGGILKYGLDSELRTLDPVNSTQLVERTVMYQMYDSLVTIDEKLNIKPGLAQSWNISPDGLAVTFNLRKDVKFHDGTDFNADAVKFNLERYVKTPGSFRKAEIASLDSVEVKDPSTAVAHLKKPDATLLSQLVDRAGMMLSPQAVQKGGADFTRNPQNAGTGPFVFVEWKRDDHLTLKKNPTYWKKGQPYLDQVIYRPITNGDARATALKTGDIDMVRTIDGKDAASIQSDSNLVFKEIPGLAYGGFWVNHASGPFTDKAKAQAVALAVDRQQIIKNIYFNIRSVSHGPIPPTSWAFDPGEKIYDKPDLARARTLATGFSFKMKVSNTPLDVQYGTLVKDQLARAGITVELVVREFGQLLTEMEAGDFEAGAVGWSGRIDPDGNMYQHFHTGERNNNGRYSNPQVDKMLEDARVTNDQGKRKQLYQQAQRTLVEDAAYIFTDHDRARQISSNKVHGYVVFPDSMPRFAAVWKS